MDLATVRDLARLCRLQLTEQELRSAQDQMTRLLGYFDMLQSLDTDAVEPSPYPRPLPHRLRPDDPSPALSQADVLGNAPAVRGGQFLVPKVVDG